MIKLKFYLFIVSFVLGTTTCYAHVHSTDTSEFNIEKIQKLTGQKGSFELDKRIYKITIPRKDLTILVGGMQLAVDRGLSSTIDFDQIDSNNTVVTGNLILLQDQVNPVMSVVLDKGLQVTGLNNPFLWDSPRVMVMRIRGEGDTLKLASAIGAVLKKIQETMNGNGDFPLGDTNTPKTSLNTSKIDKLMGVKGQFNGDIYLVQFKRAMKKTDAEVNKKMAVNTWVAFAGTDNEAVINGALVVHQSELQQALITLRKAKIYILAIYQYPIDEDSGLVSVNFWGIGNIQALAKPLHSNFLLAQNSSDSSQIKMIALVPAPLLILQNTYCSYEEKATTLASNSQQTQTPEPVIKPTPLVRVEYIPAHSILLQSMDSAKTMFTNLLVVENYPLRTFILTHPAIEDHTKVSMSSGLTKPIGAVSRLSATAILSILSVVKNNSLNIALLMHPRIISPVVAVNSLPQSVKPNAPLRKLSQNMSVLSAKAILFKLSVVRNNQSGFVFIIHPSARNYAAAVSPLPAVTKPYNAMKLARNLSTLSATAILSKLSVVKNNRIVVVFLPHRSKIG